MSLSIMGSVNTYTKTMKLQTQWNLKQQSGDYTSHKKSLDEWISTAQETLKKSRQIGRASCRERVCRIV